MQAEFLPPILDWRPICLSDKNDPDRIAAWESWKEQVRPLLIVAEHWNTVHARRGKKNASPLEKAIIKLLTSCNDNRLRKRKEEGDENLREWALTPGIRKWQPRPTWDPAAKTIAKVVTDPAVSAPSVTVPGEGSVDMADLRSDPSDTSRPSSGTSLRVTPSQEQPAPRAASKSKKGQKPSAAPGKASNNTDPPSQTEWGSYRIPRRGQRPSADDLVDDDDEEDGPPGGVRSQVVVPPKPTARTLRRQERERRRAESDKDSDNSSRSSSVSRLSRRGSATGQPAKRKADEPARPLAVSTRVLVILSSCSTASQ